MNLQENLVKYEKQFALISWIQCHTCLPEADSLSRIVGHKLSNLSLTVSFKGMKKENQQLSKFTSLNMPVQKRMRTTKVAQM